MDQTKEKYLSTRGHPVEILDNLWIGSLASLRVINQDNELWTVISVLGSDKLISMSNDFLELKKAKKECDHIVWKLSDKNDSEILCDTLKETLDVIDSVLAKEGKCLVHCAMGVSRSSTLCASWIMSRQRVSLEEAMNRIREVCPAAMPNLGFTASLRALEVSNGDIEEARKRLCGRKKIITNRCGEIIKMSSD
jgi:protein-tyrosine phosphatase